MKIHCILHASFERLGAIEDWAVAHDHALTYTHIYEGEVLPSSADDFDWLILMGGPQSPLELDKFPYIADEVLLAKKAIYANKIVFGVCLGAQIIAEALGATTLHSPNKEIGIYPVTVLAAAKDDPFFSKVYPTFNATHWHNDMPGIPEGAVLLAQSEGCPQQAFRYGDRVYGFQFHLEMTIPLIKGMVDNCPGDLKPGKYIRSIEELLNGNYAEINRTLFLFLDEMEGVFTNTCEVSMA